MTIVKTIKGLWKEALKSGKIVKRKVLQQEQRSSRSFSEFTLERRLTTEQWTRFEKDESLFRRSLASKPINNTEFICLGNYKAWCNLFKCLSSIFINQYGDFRSLKWEGFPWSSEFIQYCNRVLKSVPVEFGSNERQNKANRTRKGVINVNSHRRMLMKRSWRVLQIILSYYDNVCFYIKRTVQPYFSLKKITSSRNTDKTVPKEKLIELWSSRKKKAIEIIKNDGKWSNKVEPVVNKQKTEEYYDIKYSGVRENLFEAFEETSNKSAALLFTTEELGKLLPSCKDDSQCGKDGVFYRDLKKNWS